LYNELAIGSISNNPSHVLETKPFINNGKEERDKFTCCQECTSNYEKEVQLLKSEQQKHLLPWLQPQGTNSNQKVIKDEGFLFQQHFFKKRNIYIYIGCINWMIYLKPFVKFSG